ncbi:MAG: hemerythrin domain-containing protein [Pseudonocardia sp.]|nr:hemerythrin domain-containing protein [Pseudonocardia sp.]
MDAIELLCHDHRMVEQLFRDYQAVGSDNQRRGVVEIIVRELSKHAALEELMFYPLAKKVLPDGEKEIDEHLAEHLSVKKTLAALDELSAGGPTRGHRTSFRDWYWQVRSPRSTTDSVTGCKGGP